MSFHAKDVLKFAADFRRNINKKQGRQRRPAIFGINKKSVNHIVKEEIVHKDIYSGGLNL